MNSGMRPRAARHIPLAAALATLAFHLIANPHYGFFRDELYFIICGFRPAWGYVDQPPVVPLMAAGSQLFGHSLFLMRAVPALFAAASVYVTCLLVIELGGGAFAEVLAALVAALTPVLMAFGGKITDRRGRPVAVAAGGALRAAHRQGRRSALVARGRRRDRASRSRASTACSSLPSRSWPGCSCCRSGARFVRWFAAASPSRRRSRCRTSSGRPRTATRCGRCCATRANKERGALAAAVRGAQLLVTHPLLAPFWLIGLVALLRRADARFLGHRLSRADRRDDRLRTASTTTRERLSDPRSPPARWRSKRGRPRRRWRPAIARTRRRRRRARSAARAGAAGARDVGLRSRRVNA